MKIFDGFLLCSDVDGTLTNRNQEISKRNIEAIKYFEDNGGVFVMATGRFPEYVRQFQELLGSTPLVIAVNGTMIYDLAKDRIIYDSCLDDNAIQVLDYVDENFGFIKEILIHTATDSFNHKKMIQQGAHFLSIQNPGIKFFLFRTQMKAFCLKKS